MSIPAPTPAPRGSRAPIVAAGIAPVAYGKRAVQVALERDGQPVKRLVERASLPCLFGEADVVVHRVHDAARPESTSRIEIDQMHAVIGAKADVDHHEVEGKLAQSTPCTLKVGLHVDKRVCFERRVFNRSPETVVRFHQ